MSFTLPALTYAFDALEPHIDARTMEIHHGKHHQAYVTNLNNAIAGTDAEKLSIEDAEIEVEYQNDTIGKYDIAFNGKTFVLISKTTACLAQDACGIQSDKENKKLVELSANSTNACKPGGGCC